ncbi:hypothetical protein QQX98_003109 [Neonectria punicea]|uniref:Uncharacterized protein n=1 Tax=Neonectria punicea TaxID=979145 RepID=A0ABR1HFL8_9HYPO
MSNFEHVSEDAQERLKTRVDKKLSPTQQWHTIWDILFGTAPRPHNPYIGTVVEETVAMMRTFWEMQGKQIVWDRLHRQQVSDRNDDDLRSILVDVFDDFQVRFAQSTRGWGPTRNATNSPDTSGNSSAAHSEHDFSLTSTTLWPSTTSYSLDHQFGSFTDSNMTQLPGPDYLDGLLLDEDLAKFTSSDMPCGLINYAGELPARLDFQSNVDFSYDGASTPQPINNNCSS